jgi:hypothetical protein
MNEQLVAVSVFNTAGFTPMLASWKARASAALLAALLSRVRTSVTVTLLSGLLIVPIRVCVGAIVRLLLVTTRLPNSMLNRRPLPALLLIDELVTFTVLFALFAMNVSAEAAVTVELITFSVAGELFSVRATVPSVVPLMCALLIVPVPWPVTSRNWLIPAIVTTPEISAVPSATDTKTGPTGAPRTCRDAHAVDLQRTARTDIERRPRAARLIQVIDPLQRHRARRHIRVAVEDGRLPGRLANRHRLVRVQRQPILAIRPALQLDDVPAVRRRIRRRDRRLVRRDIDHRRLRRHRNPGSDHRQRLNPDQKLSHTHDYYSCPKYHCMHPKPC